MKKRNIIFLTTVTSITICLVVLGFIFQKTAAEKINGFYGLYDVTADEMIAYVSYEKGVPKIIGKEKDQERILYEGKENETIVDLAFSPNTKSLYYVQRYEDKENPNSAIYEIVLETGNVKQIVKESNYIIEITFDAESGEYLYYIQSSIITNYSPLAPELPHEMDVYRYHVESDAHTQLTHYNAYDMNSLHVDEAAEKLYIQMFDQSMLEDDISKYESSTVYELPLTNQREVIDVGPKTWEHDITGMGLLVNHKGMVFSGVNNFEQGDIFEYELFYYEWNAPDYERLTELQGNAERPINRINDTLYFVVDENFGSDQPAYHLYRMTMDDKQFEKQILQYE